MFSGSSFPLPPPPPPAFQEGSRKLSVSKALPAAPSLEERAEGVGEMGVGEDWVGGGCLAFLALPQCPPGFSFLAWPGALWDHSPHSGRRPVRGKSVAPLTLDIARPGRVAGLGPSHTETSFLESGTPALWDS